MPTITQSNRNNFLTWQEVQGTLSLADLQKYGTEPRSFIYTVTVTASQTISLPMASSLDSLYDFIVDFGDGGGNKSVNAYADVDRQNTYTNAGTYTITITGLFEYIKFGDSPTSLIEVKQFGDSAIGASSFNGCSNFTTISATDSPSIYQTSLLDLFNGCTVFNSVISIDTVAITNMQNMFNGCAAFNQAVDFNTGEVTNMTAMFDGCTVFNQAVPFDTGEVTNMSFMFNLCAAFNQAVGFDTSKVTNMTLMFSNCAAFNQSLASLFITALTNATNMLLNATLSTSNYDATLIGWEAQSYQNNVTAHFGNSTYTGGGAAATARAQLVTDGWTITDGGIA